MADPSGPGAGTLGEVTAADVLRTVASGVGTALVRFHGAEQRLVALSEGDVYLATSASGPSIHQIVVGSGAVPDEAWSAAGGATSGEGLAAVLDDDGRVDSERLRAVLHEHAVATLAELLIPGTERYDVLEGQTHQVGTRFRFPLDDLLTEAERRLEAWRSFRDTLPSTGTRVRHRSTLPRGEASTTVTAVEWQVLAVTPDGASVAEVIEASGLSAFTVFEVLHRLVRRGLVEPVEAGPGGP